MNTHIVDVDIQILKPPPLARLKMHEQSYRVALCAANHHAALVNEAFGDCGVVGLVTLQRTAIRPILRVWLPGEVR